MPPRNWPLGLCGWKVSSWQSSTGLTNCERSTNNQHPLSPYLESQPGDAWPFGEDTVSRKFRFSSQSWQIGELAGSVIPQVEHQVPPYRSSASITSAGVSTPIEFLISRFNSLLRSIIQAYPICPKITKPCQALLFAALSIAYETDLAKKKEACKDKRSPSIFVPSGTRKTH